MVFKYTGCMIVQGADCDIEHYLVVARVRKNFAVSK